MWTGKSTFKDSKSVGWEGWFEHAHGWPCAKSRRICLQWPPPLCHKRGNVSSRRWNSWLCARVLAVLPKIHSKYVETAPKLKVAKEHFIRLSHILPTQWLSGASAKRKFMRARTEDADKKDCGKELWLLENIAPWWGLCTSVSFLVETRTSNNKVINIKHPTKKMHINLFLLASLLLRLLARFLCRHGCFVCRLLLSRAGHHLGIIGSL